MSERVLTVERVERVLEDVRYHATDDEVLELAARLSQELRSGTDLPEEVNGRDE